MDIKLLKILLGSRIRDLDSSLQDALKSGQGLENLRESCFANFSEWDWKGFDEPELNSLFEMPRAKNFFETDLGDISLTLINNQDYTITLHFWKRVETSIHAHPFYGVSKILNGTTFELNFEFEKLSSPDSCLEYGILRLDKTITCRKGDVFKFGPGIHKPHLPLRDDKDLNISLVFRTRNIVEGMHPNMPLHYSTYLYPGIHVMNLSAKNELVKMIEILNLLSVSRETATKTFKKLINQFSFKEWIELFMFHKHKINWSKEVESAFLQMLNDMPDLLNFYQQLKLSEIETQKLRNKLKLVTRQSSLPK